MSARVAVVTGTRAEFGLLDTVMRTIDEHSALELLVFAGGAHLLKPAETWREVDARYDIAATIPMQRDGEPSGRLADAAALGRGVTGFAGALAEHRPDCVVVLGDRIEAFAAACAASVGGIPLAHIHGGDRAEGIADEAMRHAISKLAHLHLAATAQSAERLIRMGEDESRVHVVGSPAIDGLDSIAPMPDHEFEALGAPDALFLMHPIGDDPETEHAKASAALGALRDRRVLALHPNSDAGREGILAAIEESGVRTADHLPRQAFIGLCKRVGALIGNSSAGLIEASALRLPAVNIGPRQAGRERPNNVIDCGESAAAVTDAIDAAMRLNRSAITSPFGAGDAGRRTAETITRFLASENKPLHKRCAY